MLPSNLWRWQWLEARATLRRRVLESALPLALALPILAGRVGSPNARTGLLLLLTLPVAFLAALRTRDFVAAGLPSKFLRSVPHPHRRFTEAVLGELALRLVQLTPLGLACWLVLQISPGRWPGLWALQLAGTGSMVLLGVAGGVLGASLAEAALYTLVLSLCTLFACGLFGLSALPPWTDGVTPWVLPAATWIHSLRGEEVPTSGLPQLLPSLVASLLWAAAVHGMLLRRIRRATRWVVGRPGLC